MVIPVVSEKAAHCPQRPQDISVVCNLLNKNRVLYVHTFTIQKSLTTKKFVLSFNLNRRIDK